MARLFDRSALQDAVPDMFDDDARPAARALSAALSALLVSFLIVARSHVGLEVNGRTFSNDREGVAAQEVRVTDDDQGVPMFTVPALAPGSTVVKCIEVRYEGTADEADVRLHSRSLGALATRIRITVDVGGHAGYGDCAGFVADDTVYDGTLAAFSTLADGIVGFGASAPGDHRAFRFTTTLTEEPGPASGTATADFTWIATAP